MVVLYLTEVFHFVQHFVYFWNNILPVHKDWCIGAISQSNVKHSSVLKQGGKIKMNEALPKLHPGPQMPQPEGSAILKIQKSFGLTGISRAAFPVCVHTHSSSYLNQPLTTDSVQGAYNSTVCKVIVHLGKRLKIPLKACRAWGSVFSNIHYLAIFILAYFRYTRIKLFLIDDNTEKSIITSRLSYILWHHLNYPE